MYLQTKYRYLMNLYLIMESILKESHSLQNLELYFKYML